MAENFYTILTSTGKAKLANSAVLGSKVNFKTLKVGDGKGSYYEPSENQTSLVNQVWSGNIGSISVDENNPNWIVIETLIPATIGGFFIREGGIFDEDDDLIAISKLSETYKPVVSEGSIKDLCIKIILEVSNVESVTLKIDPTVIVATKKDILVIESEVKDVNARLSDLTKNKANDVDNNRTTTSKTVTGAINELNSSKAPLASPAFIGTPLAPTASVGTNTTQLATTAFVNNVLASMASNIIFSDSGIAAFRGVQGTMGGNDFWRVGGGASVSDEGYMEIATADNGSDPIYVRQYNGVFTTIARTLTLLDGSGNSTFPGTISNSVASDAILQLENTVSPTTAYRVKRIYSSNNVGSGSQWLFRQVRPSDGACIDYHLGRGGNEGANTNYEICTTYNEPCSQSSSGYKKFADGTIIQWGMASGISGTTTVTFPIAFRSACYNVQLTANNSGTQAVCSAYNQYVNSFVLKGSTTQTVFWMAIGV